MACGAGANMESIAERQENELEVLKAIYVDDVRDLREKDAWNVRRPPEIQISLGPQASFSSKEVHVCVVFVVKCPAKYPEVVPDIRIENPKGLSQQEVDILLQELKQMCQTLVGEVMILDLCQHIQKFLHAHNKPPSLSFYDEMITTKRVLEERTAREQVKQIELLEQKQAQSIEREIKKQQEALKEDARKRREQGKATVEGRNSGSDSNNILKDNVPITPILKDLEQRQRSATSPEHYTAVSHGEHKPERLRHTSTPLCGDRDQDQDESQSKSVTRLLVFNTKRERRIHLGACVGQSCRGSAVYVGLDSQSGEVVAVTEWVLKWRHTSRKLNLNERQQDEKESTKYIKQVVSVEKELLSLLRLTHKHLVHYHGIRYVQDNGRITMHLLVDHVGGGSLAAHVRRKEPLEMSLLRSYGGQTLEALTYLHERGVIHKDLRASSLMLDHEGSLRLTDISLTKRLVEVVKEVNANNNQVQFEDDYCPVIGGRSGKKADIYRFGCVLLCLAQGEKPTNTQPEIPLSLPAEFQDFLGKCLTTSELQRWSTSQLLEHSFVKTPLYRQPLEQMAGNVEQKKLQHHESEDSADEQMAIPFIPASDSGSRLQNEFEILKGLGKGGFGDVIKVKNKLDGRYYAIKRIPLNPSKKAFTRKITREVQLLSMLNHENVVRYYNSWIETSSEPADEDGSSSDLLSSSPSKTPTSENIPKKRLDKMQKTIVDNRTKRPVGTGLTPHVPGGLADWEHTAPPALDVSIEWSVSVDLTTDLHQDDSSEDEDYVFGASILPQTDSEDDGIVFEHSSNYVCDLESESQMSSNRGTEENETEITVHRLQFLYIQMEFCEKSTLRSCIDMGLYEDVSRVWRFFREIVEGLTHIHKQGMIHRDLKPVNIFLDSNDHVKIGDFGLATTEILTSTVLDMTTPSAHIDISITSQSESTEEAAEMTGKVGTALYVAPEMSASCKRTRYSQKVDIYSLGVIFFEMCYRPLRTGMERVKILSNLRDAAIQFPEDMDAVTLPHQVSLLRLLLTHNPSQRPTASEILQSDLLPPPQMEEAELNEMLRSTIANPESKLYKRMIDSLFSQPITPAMDFVYDNEVYKTTTAYNPSQAVVTMGVTEVLQRLFKRHCAVNMPMPLLMPKCDLYDNCESYVCVMNHIGGLVALPYDLKTPFARFVARYGICDLKRYTIDTVYRESRVYGLHPKELLACSFDIVTQTMANLVPDAEVINVIFEVIQEFPELQNRIYYELQNRNYYLRINHKCLLKGILLYCGVREELHNDVCAILGEVKTEHRKTQLQTRLYSLSLTDHAVDTLFHFVETEGAYKQIASMLRKITRTKGLASTLVSKGLTEIEAIISHTESLGLKAQVVLTLGLISNINHFSGVIFQVVRNIRRKNKQSLEVLAAGGRYDNLVAKFRKPGSNPLYQCVVGISISVDRIVAAIMEDKQAGLSGICDVLVCSLGTQSYTKEKLSLLKDLRGVGISTSLVHDNSLSLEEIHNHCRKSGISQIVIIKDSELRLRSMDKDKVQERRCSVAELLAYLQQKLQASTPETAEHPSSQASKSSVVSSQVSSDSSNSKEARDTYSRHQCNISFLYQDVSSKTGKNTRRNMESQIYGNIMPCLSSISTKCHIEIIAVDLTVQVLKTIAAFLELESEEKAFNESIGPIMERHGSRHRKYLTKVFDHIHELKFEKHVPVIILYGLKDDSYKVLL